MKMSMPQIYRVTSHTDHVGPGSTFVVVKGMKEDGIRYVLDALTRGATHIVVQEGAVISEDVQSAIKEHNAQLTYVPSPRLALAKLSAEAYNYPARSLKIIGITGTKGKTSTTFLVEHILKTAGCKTAVLSTVENRILDHTIPADLTTPQPDFLHAFFDQCRSLGVEYVVMEVAAQALTLQRVATIEFDAAAFTNFSLEHSEFYPTQEDYFQAKCELFTHVAPGARIVLNADDARVAGCAQLLKDPHLENYLVSLHGTGIMNGTITQSDLSALTVNLTSPTAHYACHTDALLGSFSAYNVMTAVAIVEKYGIDGHIIDRAVSTFKGVPGRLQRFDLPNKAVAFIDNAHTPSSFEALLTALRPLSEQLIVVFGAGGDRDTVKRPLMGQIAAQLADTIILTTDNPRSEDPIVITDAIASGILPEYRHKMHIQLDRERAIKEAYALSGPGTIIALLGKGPVEYQHVKDQKIPFSEAAILRSF